MKIIVSLLLCLTFLPAICQIRFEKGYFLDNTGKKTECLIENKDWLNNPEEFKYKLSENDSPLKAVIGDVSEFRVYNFSKYVRAFVQIDISNSKTVLKYSNVRNPEWVKDTLFLKVITEGTANLYEYESGELTKFFFNTPNDATIRQLVFKYYTIDLTQVKKNRNFEGSSLKILENNDFRQQLFNELKCSSLSKSTLERLSYSKNVLKKYFTKYNHCMGDAVDEKKEQVTRDFLNLRVTSGVNLSSLEVTNEAIYDKNVKFDKSVYFRLGAELEYIFPFNKNKWAVFAEPHYQYFTSNKNYDSNIEATVDYKKIDVPLGIRYYLFLNNKSRLFINIALTLGSKDAVKNSNLTYNYKLPALSVPYEIQTYKYLSVGAGYSINQFGFELRHNGSQDILGYSSFSSSYQKLSFVVSYRLFKVKSKV